MKYRLKRDLPFAKAGTDVFLIGYNVAIKPNPLYDQYRNEYFLGGKDELIADGWIEEVKPREWYVLNDREGFMIYDTRIEAEEELNKSDGFVNIPTAEIIKVREVL